MIKENRLFNPEFAIDSFKTLKFCECMQKIIRTIDVNCYYTREQIHYKGRAAEGPDISLMLFKAETKWTSFSKAWVNVSYTPKSFSDEIMLL